MKGVSLSIIIPQLALPTPDKSRRDRTLTKTLCLFSVSTFLLFFLPTFPLSLSLVENQLLAYPPHYILCHLERLVKVNLFDAPETILLLSVGVLLVLIKIV